MSIMIKTGRIAKMFRAADVRFYNVGLGVITIYVLHYMVKYV